jgi:hypothetical protein
MTLVLAVSNGEVVAPVYRGPRFRSVGGDLIDLANQRDFITLAEAEQAVDLYRVHIAEAPTEAIARLCADWGYQLIQAIDTCKEQRRAAGWRNPHDADKRTA